MKMLFWKLFIILCFNSLLTCGVNNLCMAQTRVPLMRRVNKNGTIIKKTALYCYAGYEKMKGKCVPICVNDCENGICIRPDTCECNKGYKIFNEYAKNKCLPDCGKCEHGFCSAPGVCNCNKGFQHVNDTCRPVCDNCENGYCSKPGQCDCKLGYQKSEEGKCEPICNIECRNGKCVASNKCACDEGYEMNANNVCLSVCEQGCKNGHCVAPGLCECLEGYAFSPNTYQCENSAGSDVVHGSNVNQFLKWFLISALSSALFAFTVALVISCVNRKTSYAVKKLEYQYPLMNLSKQTDV